MEGFVEDWMAIGVHRVILVEVGKVKKVHRYQHPIDRQTILAWPLYMPD